MNKKTLVLDFGTTCFKASIYNEFGVLGPTTSIPAPDLTVNNLRCEGKGSVFFEKANNLLAKMLKLHPGTFKIGIATQRSSFLLWDKKTGSTLTPVISWQDRRAVKWCEAHNKLKKYFWKEAGLPLSPHYAGPKFTSIIKSNPDFYNKILKGEILFGTLDTFFIWKWTKGKYYQTDPTMASRTLLFNIKQMKWSEKNMEIFNFPSKNLPKVMPSNANTIQLKNGITLTCSVADQTASTIAVLNFETSCASINLGTGGFISRIIKDMPKNYKGYLISPIKKQSQYTLYMMEGTINGLNVTMKKFFNDSSIDFPDKDPAPEGFCIADSSGVGAPHWKPKLPFSLSIETSKCNMTEKRRIVYEGIIFRIVEILYGLFNNKLPDKIFLSGGNSNNIFIRHGLASCIKKPIYLLVEQETTLLGVGRLSQNETFYNPLQNILITPHIKGGYLPIKFKNWKKWLSKKIA